ncbi:hypothetical protein VQ03_00375 [Methylobacterium tarhaniae]|uniref:Uncharacterized protein n=1 Tax=Methylobacterium tarhaniae TaxID=1187852 RepID=A0A0J6W095_9HYPH|nr:amino acid adenylation domain-containing protein [Methylobacterium tarhaniae]KMO44976.1 hypothetical protein VQ03_00375 [Methylobacterium tarhaniae]
MNDVTEEALLRSLLAADGFSFDPESGIPPAGDTPTEASFAQSRLWFLNQLQPNDWSYNLACAFQIDGEPDQGRIARSFADTVVRHEALGIRIEAREGRPFQVPAACEAITLRMVDAAVLPGEASEQVTEVLRVEVQRPFDLAADLPFRLTLIRAGDGRSILLIVIHHVATDGWSLPLIARDFLAAYTGCSLDAGPPAVSYRDFAAWERQRWAEGLMEKPLRYWASRLADPSPQLDFPFDLPRPAEPSHEARLTSFALPRPVIDELARRLASTPYVVLLTLYASLLGRYSSADDLIVGSTTAGRSRPELEGVVGLFANTVAHRFRLSPDESFATHVRRFTHEIFGDLDHQDMPFDRVVQQVLRDRKDNPSPLFQAAFVLQNVRPYSEEFTRAGLVQVPIPVTATRFDLSLVVEPGVDCYAVTLYRRDGLMSDELAGQFCRSFGAALADIADSEHVPLGRMAILGPDERECALRWSAGEPIAFANCTIFDAIAERAERTPDVVAVVTEDGSFSYRDTLLRATVISDELRCRGIARGSLVALLLPRSFDAVAAILGILSVGAAYLPLDPAYPVNRLAFMVEDSGAQVTVTDSATLSGLTWTPAEVLRLDELAASRTASAIPGRSGAPDDPIYVMYTSGSTGQPKATLNLNRGVANFIAGIQHAYPLHAGDRVLHKASLQFDVSAWEIFWPLMVGARLVVAPPGSQSDPLQLRQIIEGHGVSVAHFVPSMLSEFVDALDMRACTGLKTVFSGGEGLPPELIRRFQDRSAATLVNSYGPTETSIGVSLWKCPAGFDGAVAPIGRPMPNVRLYVLDRNFAPAPDGVPGQLFIAGVCVGRGYLNRPDLTRECFPDEPWHPGEQMYASGDLVRRRPDGEVVFLGRHDQQIKLRGQRIEIGEIESALRRLDGVGEVLVVADDASGKNPRLVAYVCLRDGTNGDEAAIRSVLAQYLPAIMIPSRIIFMTDMPLTVNGKVDRSKLPAPDGKASRTPDPGVMNAAEILVAEAYEAVLGTRPQDPAADFFAMGAFTAGYPAAVLDPRTHGHADTPRSVHE